MFFFGPLSLKILQKWSPRTLGVRLVGLAYRYARYRGTKPRTLGVRGVCRAYDNQDQTLIFRA